jgi:hypothetical protein
VTDAILIVAISLIAAVVVGSGVFFVWTSIEKVSHRPRATKAENATGNAEPEETERNELGQDA